MQYTVNQLKQHYLRRVLNIYDIFIGFFGEPYVDLQYDQQIFLNKITERLNHSHCEIVGTTDSGDSIYELSDAIVATIREQLLLNIFNIYVWWPQVTVTNEYDRSIDIQDLYAQIGINLDGRIPFENVGFQLNRSTFTDEQFDSYYLHSHIRTIEKSDPSLFQNPCLGHGPIVGTIHSLKIGYDETSWMLFCQELSLYVTVESINGGPWRRMEYVGNKDRLSGYRDYTENNGTYSFSYLVSKETLISFIKYYLENGHLSLSYKNNTFVSGMPYYDFIIDISNSFIEYYNTHIKGSKTFLKSCFSRGLLYKVMIIDGKFYRPSESQTTDNYEEYIGKHVLYFKGRDITLSIISTTQSEATISTVLNNDVAMFILTNIIKIINFRYRNEYKRRSNGLTESSSTNERYFYI